MKLYEVGRFIKVSRMAGILVAGYNLTSYSIQALYTSLVFLSLCTQLYVVQA